MNIYIIYTYTYKQHEACANLREQNLLRSLLFFYFFFFALVYVSTSVALSRGIEARSL